MKRWIDRSPSFAAAAACIALAVAAAGCSLDEMVPSDNNATTNDGTDTSVPCGPNERRDLITDACLPIGGTTTTTTPTSATEDPWADGDEDGVLDRADNCPGEPNPMQEDGDRDGVGDLCDNCPEISNFDQDPQACAPTNLYDRTTDNDGDDHPDVMDNCPGTPNPNQQDADGDRLGDACDNCPGVANYDQADADNDKQGDACEPEPAGIICREQSSMFTVLEPNILVLLDNSGSMKGSKWSSAISGLNAIASSLASKVRFGVSIFPGGASCGADVVLPMGKYNAQQIKNSYGSVGPTGANTPTAAALTDLLNRNVARDPSDANDGLRAKAVILITDGDPRGCNSTVSTTASAAARFDASGIPVYVIGMPGATTSSLQRFAQAGGTGSPHQASSTQQLVTAIEMIASQVIACSYTLNPAPPDPNKIWVSFAGRSISRDGANGFTLDNGNVLTLNGQACQTLRSSDPNTTMLFIKLGCATTCTPAEEICDYKDNDCDGQIDEGCEQCSPEICDDMDNDCDMMVDEGCPMCSFEGEACQMDGDCCEGQGSCIDNLCQLPCRPTGVSCRSDGDCCSGACGMAPGSSVGICISG